MTCGTNTIWLLLGNSHVPLYSPWIWPLSQLGKYTWRYYHDSWRTNFHFPLLFSSVFFPSHVLNRCLVSKTKGEKEFWDSVCSGGNALQWGWGRTFLENNDFIWLFRNVCITIGVTQPLRKIQSQRKSWLKHNWLYWTITNVLIK